jgi:hypothetical protein
MRQDFRHWKRRLPSAGVSDNGAMTTLFYAQFLFLDCNDAAAARKVYSRALEKWPSLMYLWEGALHFEEHCLEEGRTGGFQSYPRLLHLWVTESCLHVTSPIHLLPIPVNVDASCCVPVSSNP